MHVAGIRQATVADVPWRAANTGAVSSRQARKVGRSYGRAPAESSSDAKSTRLSPEVYRPACSTRRFFDKHGIGGGELRIRPAEVKQECRHALAHLSTGRASTFHLPSSRSPRWHRIRIAPPRMPAGGGGSHGSRFATSRAAGMAHASHLLDQRKCNEPDVRGEVSYLLRRRFTAQSAHASRQRARQPEGIEGTDRLRPPRTRANTAVRRQLDVAGTRCCFTTAYNARADGKPGRRCRWTA